MKNVCRKLNISALLNSTKHIKQNKHYLFYSILVLIVYLTSLNVQNSRLGRIWR